MKQLTVIWDLMLMGFVVKFAKTSEPNGSLFVPE